MSRSEYYRPKAKVDSEEKKIEKQVIHCFNKNHANYGRIRIKKLLKRKGINISESKISRILKKNGLQPNESFWHTLEVEMADISHLNFDEASRTIVEYIELYYNSQRLHSGINYHIPNEFFTLLSVH